jgi:hypothetical protein
MEGEFDFILAERELMGDRLRIWIASSRAELGER